MAISMLKIRRPLGRLIFNMGIAIPGKTVFLIETAPRSCEWTVLVTVAHSTKHAFIYLRDKDERYTPVLLWKSHQANIRTTYCFNKISDKNGEGLFSASARKCLNLKHTYG